MIVGILNNVRLLSIVIIAMWMLYSGMMKLVGYPGMEESFMAWGYDKWFMLVIGAIEVILAIAVFAKPTRNIAFVGLIILMTGAIYTHISNYEYEELGPASWILAGSFIMLLYDVLKGEEYISKIASK